MRFEDLVNDKLIKKRLQLIDKKNGNEMDHGLQHAINVVKNIEKLAKVLKLDEATLEYLKIAGYLHDLGQLSDSKNHSLESKIFVSEYLKNKVDENWYNKIISAIEKHHEKNTETLSLFEHIVLFADKMDFSYARLDKNYVEKNLNLYYFEDDVLDINFAIEDNIFIVILKFRDNKDIDNLRKWSYFSKIENRICEFANKLNMDYIIKSI